MRSKDAQNEGSGGKNACVEYGVVSDRCCFRWQQVRKRAGKQTRKTLNHRDSNDLGTISGRMRGFGGGVGNVPEMNGS